MTDPKAQRMAAAVFRPAHRGDPATVRVHEGGNGQPDQVVEAAALLRQIALVRLLVVPLQAGDAADGDLADEHLPLSLPRIDTLPFAAIHGRHGVEASKRPTVDSVPIRVEAGEVPRQADVGPQRW